MPIVYRYVRGVEERGAEKGKHDGYVVHLQRCHTSHTIILHISSVGLWIENARTGLVCFAGAAQDPNPQFYFANRCFERAWAFASSSARFFGGAFVSSESSRTRDAAATRSTAL